MKNLGVKATFNKVFRNETTANVFYLFTTDDFCETVPIKQEFVNMELSPGDHVRLDFSALYFREESGKVSAFLGCKVVGKIV